MFVVYVVTGLMSAFVSVVLIWPSDRLMAFAMAPLVASAAVLIVAIAIASSSYQAKQSRAAQPGASPLRC